MKQPTLLRKNFNSRFKTLQNNNFSRKEKKQKIKVLDVELKNFMQEQQDTKEYSQLKINLSMEKARLYLRLKDFNSVIETKHTIPDHIILKDSLFKNIRMNKGVEL